MGAAHLDPQPMSGFSHRFCVSQVIFQGPPLRTGRGEVGRCIAWWCEPIMSHCACWMQILMSIDQAAQLRTSKT